MKIKAIGVDATDIGRFRPLIKNKSKFIKDIFSERERAYCLAYKDAATHFAGIFAAKEATVKTWDSPLHVKSVEIRHRISGRPEIWVNGRRTKSLLISITHAKKIAFAIALKQ